LLLDDDNGNVIIGTVRTRKRAGNDLHRAIIGSAGWPVPTARRIAVLRREWAAARPNRSAPAVRGDCPV